MAQIVVTGLVLSIERKIIDLLAFFVARDAKQRAEAITLAARCTAWDPGRVAMADEAGADV